MQESMPLGTPEPRPIPIDDGSSSPGPSNGSPWTDPRALQILSTEHWSLLSGRSLAYNEAFSRAGMFLSFLSATLIVIGFLVGTLGLTTDLLPIVAVLLVADLYIGLATVGRLIDANGEELLAVRGMNRIRHAYLEMVPGIEPYFVSSAHDDMEGVLISYGEAPGSTRVWRDVLHGLTTTIGMIATIDLMIFAALCSLSSLAAGASVMLAIAVAALGFVVGFAIFAVIGMRTALGQQARGDSLFPTPRITPAQDRTGVPVDSVKPQDQTE